jgi:hypothetical protein
VFFLHRRPERGFTDRIAFAFLSSPAFPLSGRDCPFLPRICSAADPVLSGDHYGRQVHVLHYSLPISPAWFF